MRIYALASTPTGQVVGVIHSHRKGADWGEDPLPDFAPSKPAPVAGFLAPQGLRMEPEARR